MKQIDDTVQILRLLTSGSTRVDRPYWLDEDPLACSQKVVLSPCKTFPIPLAIVWETIAVTRSVSPIDLWGF